MAPTFVTAVIVGISYVLGSIPFGLLVARSRGIDIREHGSRNIGATNVWRVLGRKWGLITFFADAAKGWLAVTIATMLAMRLLPPGRHDLAYYGIAAAIGCILGHSFPLWLKFKGGKGVATSLGVIIGMMPLASLIVFGIWLLVFKLSRYVSLASIVGAVALPVVVIGLLFLGQLHGWANFYFAAAAALLVILRHRENIARLVSGTENRFGSSKTAPPEESADLETPPPAEPEPPGVSDR
jgi:glycerol-3-phosphate acyltransferase PlsY